jgi:hypothetical protein
MKMPKISPSDVVRAVVEEFGEGNIRSLSRLVGIPESLAMDCLEICWRAGYIACDPGDTIDRAYPTRKGWDLVARLTPNDGPETQDSQPHF